MISPEVINDDKNIESRFKRFANERQETAVDCIGYELP